MENNEQKYRQALEKGRKIHRFSSNPTVIKNMEDLFPELKESEDEKIRKELIDRFKSLKPNLSWYEIPIDDIISWLKSLKPQLKQEWSEDDEKLYTSALWHIKNSCGNGGKDSGEYEVYNWLKSIKDRVQPQQKQEWSEEDEKIINNIDSVLDYCINFFPNGSHTVYHDYKDWLKSLKHRWKPTEEQMEALTIAVHDSHDHSYYKNLYSLYNDLKSL